MSDTDVIDLTPVRTSFRGRPAQPLAHHYVRDLTLADLALIDTDRGTKTPHVQRLRDSHHRLARMMAAGKNDAEAAAMSGYSLSRISVLRSDPAFMDLLEVYRKEISDEYGEYADLAVANLVRGERLIGDALEAAGDRDAPLALNELRPVLDIVSERQDRFGFPKQQVNHNVSHDLAGRIEAARKRSGLALPPAKPEAGLVDPAPKEPVAR